MLTNTRIKMKKLITLLLIVLSFSAFSQDRQKKLERIKALRVAFLSDRLDLTPEEAQKFWPVFNQYDEKQFQLQHDKRKLMRKLRPENTATLTEKETVALMEEDEKLENDIQENRKKLVKDLQGVIPNQKILMLKQLEIEFKHKLLEQMKSHKGRR